VRRLKILGFALGGLVGLLVILALIAHLFVKPNDFKDRIAAAVKSSTGRELSLPGDIKLSVFPWIALEFGPASLSSPPGFGDEPFASVQHVAFRVQLLPLLHKDLKIGRVEVTGLDLRLKRNAAGKGNWQEPGESGKPSQGSKPSAPRRLPVLAGVQIKDSRIVYEQMLADKVTLDVGQVVADAAIPVELNLQLTAAPGAQPLPLSSKSEITLNLVAQTLEVRSFALQLANASLSGDLSASKILEAPAVHGRFKLEPVALRDLMVRLDMSPPVTRDAKALSLFAISGSLAYSGDALRLEELVAKLDETTLNGSVSIDRLESMRTSFDLTLDHIDIDRYLPPEKDSAKTPPSVPASAVAKREEKPALPSGGLASLDTQGTIGVGSAKIAGITISQARVGVLARGGVAHLAPMTAKLYGGDCAGELTLDGRAEEPVLKLEQSLTNIDVAQLLKDFADIRRLSGRGSVSIALTARGQDSDSLLKSLLGRVGLSLANGAVEGIDVWFEINRAKALIQKQTPPPGSDSGRTQFDAFKASADITDGVASSNDLTIAAQNLRVTGKGTLNLLSKAINYRIQAAVLKAPPTAKAQNAGTLAEIPLLITGTVSHPSVQPDLEELARALMQQELDKHKDELKQKLEDKLKGLLGR
jgi:AsmA protein